MLTEWNSFSALDHRAIYAAMEKAALLFDGRNILDADELHRWGSACSPSGASRSRKSETAPYCFFSRFPSRASTWSTTWARVNGFTR